MRAHTPADARAYAVDFSPSAIIPEPPVNVVVRIALTDSPGVWLSGSVWIGAKEVGELGTPFGYNFPHHARHPFDPSLPNETPPVQSGWAGEARTEVGRVPLVFPVVYDQDLQLDDIKGEQS